MPGSFSLSLEERESINVMISSVKKTEIHRIAFHKKIVLKL